MKGDHAVLTGRFNGGLFSLEIKDIEAINWSVGIGDVVYTDAAVPHNEGEKTVTLKITARDATLLRFERDSGDER